MSNDRYLRGTGSQNDAYDRDQGERDYGRDYGSGGGTSSARNYEASGGGQGRGRGGGYERDAGTRDWGSGSYGARDHGNAAYYGREQRNGGGAPRRPGQGSGGNWYGGSYASDGRRFEDVGENRHRDDDNDRARGYYRDHGEQPRDQRAGGARYAGDHGRPDGNRDYGRQPQGYDYDDRGFFQRAGDEVRSWFGDDEAERRREMDSRHDEQAYDGDRPRDRGHDPRHDDDYHSWRRGQIEALDRDYHEYRQENRSRFANEFGAWRTQRQGQRDLLNKAQEHQEVVGSDGEHIGTVDHIRGDRLLLTKNDADAGGRHHSVPSAWIISVDDKVTINKTAAEAKQQWRDEEQNGALFGEAKLNTAKADEHGDEGARSLNKSFPGTY